MKKILVFIMLIFSVFCFVLVCSQDFCYAFETKVETDHSINQKPSKENFDLTETQKIQTWTKEIKKSEILKFLIRNKIKITSISNIKQEKNENGETVFLIVGGKKIDFDLIATHFNLTTKKISKIEIKSDKIIIIGIY